MVTSEKSNFQDLSIQNRMDLLYKVKKYEQKCVFDLFFPNYRN